MAFSSDACKVTLKWRQSSQLTQTVFNSTVSGLISLLPIFLARK